MERRRILGWLLLHAALAALAGAILRAGGGETRIAEGPVAARDGASLRAVMEREQPDVVLLGNSMLQDGVHAGLLAELVADRRILKHAAHGSYTAYWYLALKNVILPARPGVVVIPFRDPLLTLPTFRTTGSYAENIAAVSTGNEPFYDHVVRLNTSASADLGERARLALRTHLPLYHRRDALQATLFDGLKGLPARPLGLPPYAESVGDVLPVRAFAATGTLDETPESSVFRTEDYYVFERVVETSFLPEIARICREAGVRLVLLRLKKGPPDWSDTIPAELLAQYGRDLDAWLAQHGVELLDTSTDSVLTPEMYRSSDHLNEIGRRHLTLKLAAWLTGKDPSTLSSTFEEVGIPRSSMSWVRRDLFRAELPPELLADGDDEIELWGSRWTLLEDGRPLGPAHEELPLIAIEGHGRYAHREDGLCFSSSDGSSPLENGRRYALAIERMEWK